MARYVNVETGYVPVFSGDLCELDHSLHEYVAKGLCFLTWILGDLPQSFGFPLTISGSTLAKNCAFMQWGCPGRDFYNGARFFSPQDGGGLKSIANGGGSGSRSF